MFHKKPNKQEIGQRGEDVAAKYLEERGFKVIDRNYRRPWGEIDLVVQRDKEVGFIEVKTVSRVTLSEDDYEPEDNLHPWKLKRLRRIIQTYVLAKNFDDDIDWQVDVISVYLDLAGETLKIDWLEDITP
ncbi:MAG: YraN family protein [Patescibacteria group bacterium]|nr:YraN family protein [Patescibacteria group bacterium]